MLADEPIRTAYILKMYPRFSETFIVNEILAHEAAGLPIEIFSLRPPVDGRFHENYAHVRAPVSYVAAREPKAAQFWEMLHQAVQAFPNLWPALQSDVRFEVTDILQAVEIAKVVGVRGITHLHAHFGSVATTVAWLVNRLTGVPYTFTAHAKDIFHESVDPADLRCKLNDASAAITVSDFNVDYLQRHFGRATARVQRIYNGLDLARFAFAPPAERPPDIVAVGRLVEKKGFDVLVQACAGLAERNREFTCKIIGTGQEEEALRRQIAALGLEARVHLLGPQPQDEVIRQVQSGAVLAAPCIVGEDGNRDGLPTVLLEAMALGTPCIATDVTGIPEVLHHNQTGLMVPQRDPAALTLALECLLYDPTLRVRLARSARSLIETNFDVHKNAAQIRQLFHSSPTLPAIERLKTAPAREMHP